MIFLNLLKLEMVLFCSSSFWWLLTADHAITLGLICLTICGWGAATTECGFIYYTTTGLYDCIVVCRRGEVVYKLLWWWPLND